MNKYLIILEGIASSGKTTLMENLERSLSQSYKVKSFSEDQTLMTIANDRRFESAQALMKKLLVEFQAADAQIILTDRYHFSLLCRTGEGFGSISELEHTLMSDFVSHIFLLTIQEDKISDRVQDSWNRRGAWLGKKGSIEEKTEYYIGQQRRMHEFAQQSKIPVTEIDTTSMDWPNLTNKIIQTIVIS